MTRARRLLFELVLLLVGASALVAWSALRLVAARDRARIAAEDLQSSRELAARIVALRARPARADVQEKAASETATRIEGAAKTAQIPTTQSLVSIAPETPRRIGKSAYKEAPTQILLRGVTMSQLVNFLLTLSDESGLAPRSLRLVAPRESSGDRWTAELSVSYLIYDPLPQHVNGRGESQ